MIVYTAGAWDLLHVGHVSMLEQSKAKGELLVVGVMTDEFIERSKGRRPVIPCEYRAAMVGSLKCVDFVEIHDDHMDCRPIEKYNARIRTIGPEYGKEKEGQREALREMARRRIQIIIIDRFPGVSTTGIIERINSDRNKT